MEDNNKVQEKKYNNNSNYNEKISSYSYTLNPIPFEEKEKQMKEISDFLIKNSSEDSSITSTSHILDDAELLLDFKFENIYDTISQIFEKNYFIYNVEEDKIIIKNEKNNNKNYKNLLELTEKYKKKILELIYDFIKFTNYIEKVKVKIKTELGTDIILKFKANKKIFNNDNKYLNCEYRIKEIELDNYNYQELDILNKQNLVVLNDFINKIKSKINNNCEKLNVLKVNFVIIILIKLLI